MKSLRSLPYHEDPGPERVRSKRVRHGSPKPDKHWIINRKPINLYYL